jgi:hypothetical protein
MTGKIMLTNSYELHWMQFTLKATEEETKFYATERYSNNNNNNNNNNN